MKHLIEFPLEDGTTTLVEADVPEEPEMPERARQTFEAALDRIRPAAQVLTPST